MHSRFSHTSTLTKLILVVEFFLVAYLLYSLTKNIYNTYQVDKYIETFETENSEIAAENKKKNEDYLYFTSEEYMDKIAKQNLGLINPGEEVIIIAPETLEEAVTVDEDTDVAVAKYSNESNVNNWWQFFFGE